MWKGAGSRGTKFHPKCKHQGSWDQDLCPEAAVQIIETIHPRQRQKSKYFFKKNGKGGKAWDFWRRELIPQRGSLGGSTSGSSGLSRAVVDLGATNVTFQESSTNSPLESLHFLPETRFFSRQCQQARESRIQPPICVRNLFGKNKEDAGAEGASSLPARARPGVRAGHPVRLCLRRDSSIHQPSCPTGDWDPPTTREKSVPRRGPMRDPESPVSRRDPPVGTGHLEGGTGLDSALGLIEPSGSLTGHSEAPAPTWPPKSPHLEQS